MRETERERERDVRQKAQVVDTANEQHSSWDRSRDIPGGDSQEEERLEVWQ